MIAGEMRVVALRKEIGNLLATTDSDSSLCEDLNHKPLTKLLHEPLGQHTYLRVCNGPDEMQGDKLGRTWCAGVRRGGQSGHWRVCGGGLLRGFEVVLGVAGRKGGAEASALGDEDGLARFGGDAAAAAAAAAAIIHFENNAAFHDAYPLVIVKGQPGLVGWS